MGKHNQIHDQFHVQSTKMNAHILTFDLEILP